MTIHRSLRVNSGLVRQRNVWTRSERLLALRKAGKHGEGDSVYGLPKVRTRVKARKKKKEEGAEAAGAAEAKPAETPAG